MGRQEAARKGCCQPLRCSAGTSLTPVINDCLGERKPLLTSQHLPLPKTARAPDTHARGCAAKADKFRFETHAISKGGKKKKGTHSITWATSPTTDRGMEAIEALPPAAGALGPACPDLAPSGLSSPMAMGSSEKGDLPPSAEGQGERRRGGTGHLELGVPSPPEPGAEGLLPSHPLGEHIGQAGARGRDGRVLSPKKDRRSTENSSPCQASRAGMARGDGEMSPSSIRATLPRPLCD